MTWAITVKMDVDKTDVGNVIATWTDTTYGTFTYSERIEATSAAATAFVNEAIAARNAWQTKQSDDATKETYILGLFSSNDPQAGS